MDVRKLSDMRKVLADQDFAKSSPDAELYFMNRGIEEKDGLRYDITTIPVKMIGSEFVKTKGHYHVGKFQEIYTVLEGEAIYLLQKRKERTEDEIEDVYAVTVKSGQAAIMPPSYGHVTINPSETEDLKMANWVSKNCQSDYSSYVNLQGACYYYTKNGWIKNPNYKSVPELRFEEPLQSLPENLDFLK